MDSDEGKLFIGGIPWETTEERLKEHFSSYGEVAEVVIMKDRATGRARGFGFVVFSDPVVADQALLDKHTIDGKTVPHEQGWLLNPDTGRHSRLDNNHFEVWSACHQVL